MQQLYLIEEFTFHYSTNQIINDLCKKYKLDLFTFHYSTNQILEEIKNRLENE